MMIAIDTEAIRQRIRTFERKADFTELNLYIDAELKNIASEDFPLQNYETVLAQYPYYRQLLIEHPDIEEFIERYLPRILPVAQSPFPLSGRRLVQGPWSGYHKAHHFEMCGVTEASLSGKRVLDVGCNAGFDTFYLSTLDPCEVVSIEPGPFFTQAMFFWATYHCPSVHLLKAAWQDVTSAAFDSFDLINCQGILYHEQNPIALLDWLMSMLAPGGRLVLETHVTLEEDQKARYVEGDFWGSDSWWWIPSVPVVLAMLRSCGFADVLLRDQYPVPSKNPSDATHTPEGIPVGGRAYITATRA